VRVAEPRETFTAAKLDHVSAMHPFAEVLVSPLTRFFYGQFGSRCKLPAMSLGQRRKSVLSGALLFLLAFTLIGHVCVLPFHHHGEASPHDSDNSPHDADDSVHAASCEAVRSTTPTPQCASVFSTSLVNSGALLVRQEAPVVARARARSSPPLFLLHAALLI
jgi:hypothetical protein